MVREAPEDAGAEALRTYERSASRARFGDVRRSGASVELRSLQSELGLEPDDVLRDRKEVFVEAHSEDFFGGGSGRGGVFGGRRPDGYFDVRVSVSCIFVTYA